VFRSVESDASGEVVFTAFYKQYQKPYIVYWDVLDEARRQARLEQRKAELARQKALDSRTVDRVLIADGRSERAHQLAGEKMWAGTLDDRVWRHATDGGWFSYQLKVAPDKPLELLVSYWGSDSGPREFDILIDGTKIATQKLDRNRPDQFYDEVYPIPADLLKGKQSVTIRFQGHPGKTAGGIFDCRVLTK